MEKPSRRSELRLSEVGKSVPGGKEPYQMGVSTIRKFLIAFLLVVTATAFAQDDDNYVPRFDAFGGYSYLASPKMNLYQRGFNGEFGVNVNRWIALGVDYSILNGKSAILPRELDPTIQAKLAPIAATFPAGYQLSVPFEARTQTFTAGPQLNIRSWKPVTFFVRPAIGLLHESVTAKPTDAIQKAVVNNLVPGGKKKDTVWFYGVGGGFDINTSRHVAIRVGVDFVHTFLFEGFLGESRNSVRISAGPTYRWGSVK